MNRLCLFCGELKPNAGKGSDFLTFETGVLIWGLKFRVGETKLESENSRSQLCSFGVYNLG